VWRGARRLRGPTRPQQNGVPRVALLDLPLPALERGERARELLDTGGKSRPAGGAHHSAPLAGAVGRAEIEARDSRVQPLATEAQRPLQPREVVWDRLQRPDAVPEPRQPRGAHTNVGANLRAAQRELSEQSACGRCMAHGARTSTMLSERPISLAEPSRASLPAALPTHPRSPCAPFAPPNSVQSNQAWSSQSSQTPFSRTLSDITSESE
jgi:hypothetical protein